MSDSLQLGRSQWNDQQKSAKKKLIILQSIVIFLSVVAVIAYYVSKSQNLVPYIKDSSLDNVLDQVELTDDYIIYWVTGICFFLFLFQLIHNGQLAVLVTEKRSALMQFYVIGLILLPIGMFLICAAFYVLNNSSGALIVISCISGYIGSVTKSAEKMISPIFISFILGTVCISFCIIGYFVSDMIINVLVYMWSSVRLILPPGSDIRMNPDAFRTFLNGNMNLIIFILFVIGILLFVHTTTSLVIMTRIKAGEVLQLFDFLDKDGDGYISMKDLERCLIELHIPIKEDTIKGIFGYVSYSVTSRETEYLIEGDLELLMKNFNDHLKEMDDHILENLKENKEIYMQSFGLDGNMKLTQDNIDEMRTTEESLYPLYRCIYLYMQNKHFSRGLTSLFSGVISFLLLGLMVIALLIFSLALLYLNICSYINVSKTLIPSSLPSSVNFNTGYAIQHDFSHGNIGFSDSTVDGGSISVYRCSISQSVFDQDHNITWSNQPSLNGLYTLTATHNTQSDLFYLGQDFSCPTLDVYSILPAYNETQYGSYSVDLSSSYGGRIQMQFSTLYPLNTIHFLTDGGSQQISNVEIVEQLELSSNTGDISLEDCSIMTSVYTNHKVTTQSGIIYVSNVNVDQGKIIMDTIEGYVNITKLKMSTTSNNMVSITNKRSYTYINGMNSKNTQITAEEGAVFIYGISIYDGSLRISTLTGDITLQNCDLQKGTVQLETYTGNINISIPTNTFMGTFTFRTSGSINIIPSSEIYVNNNGTRDDTNAITGYMNCQENCNYFGEITITSTSGNIEFSILAQDAST
ncbi:hypothetical protein WA158_004488 [Blastocystis sp. Blastoise]